MRAVGKVGAVLVGCLHGQAGLANTAWPGYRQQPGVGGVEQALQMGEFPAPADERRRLEWQIVGVPIEGLEWWKVGWQASDHQLKDLAGLRQILQPMHSKVQQAHTLWEPMFYQVACGLGEQHLSAITGAHDAGSLMHIQAHITLSRPLWFAGVQPHAHRYAFRPHMSEKGALASDRSSDGIAGAREGHEEGISLRIDLVTAELEERGA